MKILLIIICFSQLLACSNSPTRVQYEELTIVTGVTYETAYLKDKLFTGILYDTYSNGQLSLECEYRDGKRNGLTKEWYDNGQLRFEQTYKNDIEDGSYISYHPDGTTAVRCSFVEGEIDGLWQMWDSEGVLEWEFIYRNGIVEEKLIMPSWANQ